MSGTRIIPIEGQVYTCRLEEHFAVSYTHLPLPPIRLV